MSLWHYERVSLPRAIVSRRAVYQRCDRALAKDGQRLRTTRPGTRAEADLGAHYIVDINGNFIVGHHVDLAALAAELQVLEPWETIEDEES